MEERRKIIERFSALLKNGKREEIANYLKNLDAHEIALLINEADEEVREILIDSIEPSKMGDVLFELSSISRELIEKIRSQKFREIITKVNIPGGVFVSELVNNPVMEPSGKKVGLFYDMMIDFEEIFPQITAIIVKRNRKLYRLPWEDVEMFNRRFVVSKKLSQEWKEYEVSHMDVLIIRDILDKQIVDINGAKIVRVNDVKIVEIKNKLFVLGVETGMAGIIRRLSLERIFSLLRIKPSSKFISWNLFKPLEPKVSRLTLSITNMMLKEIHPSDIADIVEELPESQRMWFIDHLPPEIIADVIEELEPIYQAGIIENLKGEKARKVIQNIELDKAADIISSLSDISAKKMLSLMEKEDAKDIEELLQHHRKTAGGLMTPHYITFPPETKVGEAIDMFKEKALEIEAVYYIYITEGDELKGVLSLRELLLAEREKRLQDVMVTNIKYCTPDMIYKEVAQMFSNYNLIALPVLDEGKLVGVVTVDDILEMVFPPQR